MKQEDIDVKKELRALLRYYDKRLDSCTMAEMMSLHKMLVNNMDIDGTIDDFAQFYGKSKDAVSSQIKRNLMAKPKRNVVLYPFHAFRKIVPRSWRAKD